MLSKLREVISEIAEINEIKVENYELEKIRLIEKHLDADEDVDKAMEDLDKVLGFQWNKYLADIREKIERIKRNK